MCVRDVVRTKDTDVVRTIGPDATIEELLDKLAEYDFGALVVSGDGRTVDGIVSERDIVRKLRTVEHLGRQTVASIMTERVRTCSPDDSFETLMSMMSEHRVRHVPVVEAGSVAAVLTIGDAVKYRMDKLQFERDQLNEYVATAR